jgi:hypothetical protein
LREELHKIYAGDFLITPVHRLLAESPEPLLIVTTSFDTTMERAFDEARRVYDVVVYPTERKELSTGVLLWGFGSNKPKLIAANELYIDLTRRTVIYKIQGSVCRNDPLFDSYVITEGDYIEMLARLGGGPAVPAQFVRQFQKFPLLFLGYGLRDWTLRQMLFQLKFSSLSWSIQSHPSELEKQLWNARRVKLYDIDVFEFVNQLRDTI